MAGAGSAMGQRPAGAAADVEVEFIDADGTPRREPLSGCWNVAFERVAAFGDLRRSAGSATGRVCGGSPLPVRRTAPATAPRPDAPATGPATEYLTSVNWQTSARAPPLINLRHPGQGLPVPQIRMAQDTCLGRALDVHMNLATSHCAALTAARYAPSRRSRGSLFAALSMREPAVAAPRRRGSSRPAPYLPPATSFH